MQTGPIVFVWDDPGEPVDKYYLYYRSCSRHSVGCTAEYTTILIPGSVTRYEVSLENPRQYCYYIEAHRGMNRSDYSNEICFPPAAPTGFRVE